MYYRDEDHDSEQDIHEQHEHHDHHHMGYEMIEPGMMQPMVQPIMQPTHMCPWAHNCLIVHHHMDMMHNQTMPYGGEMEDHMDYYDMGHDMMHDEDDEDSRQFFIRPPRPYNQYHQPYHPYPRPRPFFYNFYPPYPPYPPYHYYSPYHHHDHDHDDYDDYDED